MECALQMKCKLGLDELASTSGHLRLKVSGPSKNNVQD